MAVVTAARIYQVVQWRRQQEMDLLPSQRMSETALQRFIQHYQRLTQWQWQHPIRGRGLKVDLTPEHDISNIHVLAQNA
jgi:pantothenate kinase-related protein Tda10